MSRTEILIGPPGTGKTTRLLSEVDAALKGGMDPARIAFFAFTRKAAHEAVERAKTLLDLKETDLPWFRTLHSAAFRLLGLSTSDVMQDHHYKELGTAIGCRFERDYDEATERVFPSGAMGDRCMFLYSRARSRGVSIEQEWREDTQAIVTKPDVSLGFATYFANSLEAYKKEYGLLDFTDFLDEVYTELDLDLLIIDEAQDLTFQQWEFVRRIGKRAKRVIIAGDDDQAIFQWAGADLSTFLRIKGTVNVLPRSYRLPRPVWQLAGSISRRINYRFDKQFDPRDSETGHINYLDAPDQANLLEGESWLLLARMGRQANAMRDLCRMQGVVYKHKGIWSNRSPGIRAVVDYEALRRGESIPAKRLEHVMNLIRYGEMPHVRQEYYDWSDVRWPFEGSPPWFEVLYRLDADEAAYIRMLRRNNESLVHPGRVTISTIHSIKGGEAEHVLITPDLNKRIVKSMHNDPDAEHRVWYVGVSRAKEVLHVVNPSRRHYYAF